MPNRRLLPVQNLIYILNSKIRMAFAASETSDVKGTESPDKMCRTIECFSCITNLFEDAVGNSSLLASCTLTPSLSHFFKSQYLTNLMHKICFTISFISCLYMFRAHVLIIRRSKLHYTASGITKPIGGRLVHETTTYS